MLWLRPIQQNTREPEANKLLIHLGYNDFFLQDLHGVVGAARLLPHQDDFPKSAFAQKLQIVKVIHCLDKDEERRVKKLVLQH